MANKERYCERPTAPNLIPSSKSSDSKQIPTKTIIRKKRVTNTTGGRIVSEEIQEINGPRHYEGLSKVSSILKISEHRRDQSPTPPPPITDEILNGHRKFPFSFPRSKPPSSAPPASNIPRPTVYPKDDLSLGNSPNRWSSPTRSKNTNPKKINPTHGQNPVNSTAQNLKQDTKKLPKSSIPVLSCVRRTTKYQRTVGNKEKIEHHLPVEIYPTIFEQSETPYSSDTEINNREFKVRRKKLKNKLVKRPKTKPSDEVGDSNKTNFKLKKLEQTRNNMEDRKSGLGDIPSDNSKSNSKKIMEELASIKFVPPKPARSHTFRYYEENYSKPKDQQLQPPILPKSHLIPPSDVSLPMITITPNPTTLTTAPVEPIPPNSRDNKNQKPDRPGNLEEFKTNFNLFEPEEELYNPYGQIFTVYPSRCYPQNPYESDSQYSMSGNEGCDSYGATYPPPRQTTNNSSCPPSCHGACHQSSYGSDSPYMSQGFQDLCANEWERERSFREGPVTSTPREYEPYDWDTMCDNSDSEYSSPMAQGTYNIPQGGAMRPQFQGGTFDCPGRGGSAPRAGPGGAGGGTYNIPGCGAGGGTFNIPGRGTPVACTGAGRSLGRPPSPPRGCEPPPPPCTGPCYEMALAIGRSLRDMQRGNCPGGGAGGRTYVRQPSPRAGGSRGGATFDIPCSPSDAMGSSSYEMPGADYFSNPSGMMEDPSSRWGNRSEQMPAFSPQMQGIPHGKTTVISEVSSFTERPDGGTESYSESTTEYYDGPESGGALAGGPHTFNASQRPCPPKRPKSSPRKRGGPHGPNCTCPPKGSGSSRRGGSSGSRRQPRC